MVEENFFTFGRFYDWVAGQADVRTAAEVGVWNGESIAYLADKLRARDGVPGYAVDLFERSYAYADLPFFVQQIPTIREAYESTLKRTATRHIITDVQERSDLAALSFPDAFFDFVFIDADHSYEQVRRDVLAWRAKLRPGGILSGHDYWPEDMYAGDAYAVSRALHEIFTDDRLNVIPDQNVCWTRV